MPGISSQDGVHSPEIKNFIEGNCMGRTLYREDAEISLCRTSKVKTNVVSIPDLKSREQSSHKQEEPLKSF